MRPGCAECVKKHLYAAQAASTTSEFGKIRRLLELGNLLHAAEELYEINKDAAKELHRWSWLLSIERDTEVPYDDIAGFLWPKGQESISNIEFPDNLKAGTSKHGKAEECVMTYGTRIASAVIYLGEMFAGYPFRGFAIGELVCAEQLCPDTDVMLKIRDTRRKIMTMADTDDPHGVMDDLYDAFVLFDDKLKWAD